MKLRISQNDSFETCITDVHNKILLPVSVIIPLFLLSMLLSFCFNPYIQDVATSLIPEGIVTVTILEREAGSNGRNDVYIIGYKDSLFKEIANSELPDTWEFRDKDEWPGYAVDIICSSSVGSQITFRARKNTEAVLWLHTVSFGGLIKIECDGDSQIIDLYGESGWGVTGVYPFRNCFDSFFIKSISIIVFCILVFFVLLVVYLLLIRGIKTPKFLQKEHKTYFTVPGLFTFFYVYSFVCYKFIGIQNFLAFGDQNWYWEYIDFFDGLTFTVNNYVAVRSATFRGYLSSLIPSISHAIGFRTRIDPVAIFYIFLSISAAFMLGWAIPKLVEYLTGKKTKLYQTIIFSLLFLIFWNSLLLYVSADLFGLSLFLCGLACLVKYLKTQKIRYSLVAGALLSASVLFRTSYLYAIIAIIVTVIIGFAIKSYRLLQGSSIGKVSGVIYQHKKEVIKTFFATISFILAFLIVCIPQAQINSLRGHSGILPYDSEYNGYDSLVTYHMNMSFSSNFIMWPNNVPADSQIANIKLRHYDSTTQLTFEQVMDAFISSPVDTLIYIGKKLLAGFDIKTNTAYPDDNFIVSGYKNSVKFNLFGFVNFSILFCGIWAMLTKRQTIREKVSFWIMFIFLVLTQTVLVMESRYILIGFFILYYFFVYHFIPDYISNEGVLKCKCNVKFLYFLTASIYIATWISHTFYF